MARRGRKRRAGSSRGAPPAAPRRRLPENGSGATRGAATNGGDAMARGYARSRARDDAARAALVPLAPGERPRAVTAAAVLAALIAAGNLLLIAAGWEVDGDQPVAGGLVFTGVMVIAAVGMWKRRDWAVLGFEVLLGVSLVFALLGLLRASNLEGVLACLAVIAIAGPLFWFLIRAMARIQLPARRPREPVG